MPFPFPTPAEAASSRANSGFFSRVGSTLLHKAPYVGPAYNALSSIAHLFEGTQGQYGPATSVLGRIFSGLGSNPTNAPSALAASGGVPAPGALQGPPAPPAGQPAAPPAAAAQPAGTLSIQDLLGNNRVWNALRPAFGVTAQQYNNPGSAIGQIQGLFNPYNPNAPVAPFFSLMGGNAPPSWARTNSLAVQSRNIP